MSDLSKLQTAVLEVNFMAHHTSESALVAYHVASHSPGSSDFHLEQLLGHADEITRLAAVIREELKAEQSAETEEAA